MIRSAGSCITLFVINRRVGCLSTLFRRGLRMCSRYVYISFTYWQYKLKPFQTGVALNRIAVFLEEDEVSEQVSSLKQSYSGAAPPGESDAGLGFSSASFKWNEVEETRNSDGCAASPASAPAVPSFAEESTVTVDAVSEISQEHRFELRDLNVRFPEGKLTLVTGPTASGKTALLVLILVTSDCLPLIVHALWH